MSYWGKVIGGMAGFAMGGPMGALFGAAIGHAADEGVVSNMAARAMPFVDPAKMLDAARVAALLGRREQIFAIGVTVLAAKLAKCDGPVVRAEIDGFKRSFAIPEGSVQEVGRLFDNARQNSDGYETYAVQLGQAFSDNRGVLEQVLQGLYNIARCDGPVNAAEEAFLARVAAGFGIAPEAAKRAGYGAVSDPVADPYTVLGCDRRATNEVVRERWKQLMRENHPDSLASRGVPADMIAKASDRVARINAAYDQIKRDRKL
jgi:DnaJ like chaperone protein